MIRRSRQPHGEAVDIPLTDERLLTLAARREGFHAGCRGLQGRCGRLVAEGLLVPFRARGDRHTCRYRATLADPRHRRLALAAMAEPGQCEMTPDTTRPMTATPAHDGDRRQRM